MNDSETAIPEAPTPPVPELTATELRLERERCALDMERLSLERERLETERLRLQRERDAFGGGSNALHVGIGVLALAVAVVLALGLLFGYNAGVDVGRQQSPPPRKVRVSRDFLAALRHGTAAEGMEQDADLDAPAPWFTLYTRPAADRAIGNLPLVR